MAFSALSSLVLPFTIAVGGLAVILIFWLIRFPRLAISFLLLTLITGQLLRFPLPGQGGGLLPSDIAVVVVLLAAGIRILFSNSRPLSAAQQSSTLSALPPITPFIWCAIPFIAWSLFTLLLRVPDLSLSHTAIAFSYWLRLSATLLLLPALVYLLRDTTLYRFTQRAFVVAVLLLVAVGLIQLIFLPDLSLLAHTGWDPHQFRLVSTWLDPNFFGIFLVLALPVFSLWPSKPFRLLAISLILIALVATRSRSAIVAGGITALLLSPLFLYTYTKKISRHTLITFIAIIGLVLTVSAIFTPVLWPRLAGLLTLDPTVQLRLNSLADGWRLVREHSLLGVGYNAYQFVVNPGSSTTNFTIHSRAGADNSLLTIWATTGLIGFVMFLIPWAYLCRQFLYRVLTVRDPRALYGLFSIIALLLHSQFINSFLYSHLLITLAVILALTWPRP